MDKTVKEENSALHVEGLNVNFDTTSVLWDIHFSVPSAALVAIIGPNGAGKTTLLKTLLGVVKPLAGKISYFGEPLKKLKKRIAYVPQRASVDWDFPLTAFELVLMGRYGKLGYFLWPKKADRQAAEQALELVGMSAFRDRQISQLSGGQQQRLFLARALLQDADIYFLDEPFAGVDRATEKTIIALLDKLKLQGKTLLVVHHDLSTVDTYFDWVVMLNTCLVACGPVQEAFNADTIMRTYGKSHVLLEEVSKLTQKKRAGM